MSNPTPARKAAVELSATIEHGLKLRTLRLLPNRQAHLAIVALELVKNGKKDALIQEQQDAHKLYWLYYNKVLDWYRDRVKDGGKITITYPDCRSSVIVSPLMLCRSPSRRTKAQAPKKPLPHLT